MMSATPSPRELLVTYRCGIRDLTRQIHALMSKALSRDELFDIGVQGMLEAAPRYDPTLGVPFWTFAYPRVRGAMIDAVRLLMPVPPHLYRRLATADASLRASVVGSLAHQEAVRAMGEAIEAVGVVTPQALAVSQGEMLGVEDGLDRPSIPDTYEVDTDEVEPRELDAPRDDGASLVMREAIGAHEALETHHMHAALHAAMAQLTLQERMILRGLYFEERGLVNRELGLSKAWTSRIHTRALRRLKDMLAEWSDVPAKPRRASEACPIALIPTDRHDEPDDAEHEIEEAAA
jgi:RNA polymerase sigma factor for flagellar operon FliA